MRRTRIIFFLAFAILALTLVLPAVARADDTTNGWTWDAPVATSTDPAPAPDGWTWDETAAAAPDGWTWDDAVVAAVSS